MKGIMVDLIEHRRVAPLIRLSRDLLRIEDQTGLSNALPSLVQVAFRARLVVLKLFGHGQFFSIEGKTRRVEVDRKDTGEKSALQMIQAGNGGRRCSVMLKANGETCGYMVVHGGTLTQETVGQVEEIVSIALERAQSFERTIQVMAARENARYRRELVDRLTQELRTPLTAIKGATTALLRIEASPEDRRELLTIIDEESDRINRFISAAMPEKPMRLPCESETRN